MFFEGIEHSFFKPWKIISVSFDNQLSKFMLDTCEISHQFPVKQRNYIERIKCII